MKRHLVVNYLELATAKKIIVQYISYLTVKNNVDDWRERQFNNGTL